MWTILQHRPVSGYRLSAMSKNPQTEATFEELPPEPVTTVFYSHRVLAEKLERGEFDRLKANLREFVLRHKDEIVQTVNELPEVVDRRVRIVETIGTLIEESKSVSPATEMADQINEINKEIWYQGEKGQTDRARISEEWTRRYAAQWRNARLQELLYLVEAMADELIEIVEK